MSEKINVTLNEGKVRGIKRRSCYSGVDYYSFFGIPYGQAPQDQLRFKDPVKVKPWRNVYDATVEKEGCVQFSFHTYQWLGTEDCLYSNIHIPNIYKKGDPLKPVIVNIHPGAFAYGSPDSNQYGSPEFIMSQDVVYVGICYRLHILGYLNLRLKECSGNQGIKDVIMGLEWIKSNIHSFGGDPNNITLYGASNGSIIVQMLMVSPRSQGIKIIPTRIGLFHKAVMLGNYLFCPEWLLCRGIKIIPTRIGLFHKAVMLGNYLFCPVIPFEENNYHYALKIAQELGYSGGDNDLKKVLIYLKKIPASLLIEQTKLADRRNYTKQAKIFPSSVFLPTLDDGKNAVLPQHPRKLLESSMKIPVIFGINEHESIIGFCKEDVRVGTHQYFASSYCQNLWGWAHELSEPQIQTNYEKIKSFYQISDPIEKVDLITKVDIQTDASLSDVYDTLIDSVAPCPAYVYKFEFVGKIRTTKDGIEVFLKQTLPGTTHGSDYSYWYYFSDPLDNETARIVDFYTKVISTFAKTGNPNFDNCPVQWVKSTADKPCYLSINNTIKMMDGKLNHDRLVFWDTLKKSSQNV